MYTKKTKGPQLLLAVLALVLVFCCSIGGTLAWLTAKTDPVVNTFTVGDINISLYESPYDQKTNSLLPMKSDADAVTENTYKIVPGMVMPKDPRVTVREGSEPCWVFLKVEEVGFTKSENGINYTLGSRWKPLTGETNIYYFELTPKSLPNLFNSDGTLKDDDYICPDILSGSKVTVSGNLTKEDLTAMGDTISLNFTAYAIQYDGFPTVQEAWAQINATYKITTTATSAE